MNDQQFQQKKPRKILGNGSCTDFINPANSYLCNQAVQQPNLLNNTNSQNVLSDNISSLPNLVNNTNNQNVLTDNISSLPTINILQQQQMDRFRMNTIMNQEMHALWPYGTATFLSPMLTAHNMPLPYALAGALPYAAVPIYQSLPNGNAQPCAMSPASSPSSGSSSTVTISNQQYLLRSNSIINNTITNEPNLSLRNSPTQLCTEENTTIVINGAGGDATNSVSTGSSSDTVILSQAKFNELTRLALQGSEIAEKLAYTHRNRPCFKKIDSLCARMKQDLIRPDGVLPNINSQGIAWAVKDFIFVFTRVINAWIIIKGYVYNTPEGLNKVKSALSPEFQLSFAAWQDTTMDFIENLIKSFVNLDKLVQSQKNLYQKTDNNGIFNRNGNVTNPTTPIKLLQHGNPLLEESFDFLNTSAEKGTQNSLDKNYTYTMVEDSEGSQRQATVNGTYFKTGTYTPIKKDANLPEESSASTSSNALPNNTKSTELEQYFDEHFHDFWTSAVNIEYTNKNTDIPTNANDLNKFKENVPNKWMNYVTRVLDENIIENSTGIEQKSLTRRIKKDFVEKLNVMIERLNTMITADFFFKMQFTENYFPDFVAKHRDDFIDIRSIIFQCQVGIYQNIHEVVHDVRKVINAGKEYLRYINGLPKVE